MFLVRYICLLFICMIFFSYVSIVYAQEVVNVTVAEAVPPPSDNILDDFDTVPDVDANLGGGFYSDSKFSDGDVTGNINDFANSAQSSDEGSAGNDSFFDANDLVPQSEMGRRGPINVDPSVQPASKFMIVHMDKNVKKDVVRLVSAERALSLGRLDSAILMFDELYNINNKDPRVLMGRAVTLQKLGRFDEAMQMYEQLSKLEPDNIDVKINMLGLLGTRYPSIALRRLLDLYEYNKGNVVLIGQIAIAYAKVGDAVSALKYLGMAASMEPENANHVYNMAVIADRAGDEQKAIEYYEKALEIDTVHGAGRSIPRDMVYERLALIR